MDANLVRRIAFAAVAIPLALGVVWFGGLPLAAVVALISALGTRELFDFARRQGIEPIKPLGIVVAASVGPLIWAALQAPALGATLAIAWPSLVALWLLVVLSATLWIRPPDQRPLGAAAVTVLAPLYTAVLPSFLLVLRHSDHGERSSAGVVLVFFPLIVTWVCDTAAMFGGRLVGGAKLAPVISPGKTRAGAVAGVLGGLAVAPLFTEYLFPQTGLSLGLGAGLLIAAVLSVVGQVGDLAESLFKREAGVKDSSSLIPGHGGILDRFDSLYFVLPTAAVLYRLLGVL